MAMTSEPSDSPRLGVTAATPGSTTSEADAVIALTTKLEQAVARQQAWAAAVAALRQKVAEGRTEEEKLRNRVRTMELDAKEADMRIKSMASRSVTSSNLEIM